MILVRPFGKIAVFGVCPPDARATFRPFQVFRRDLTIVGSHSASHTFLESIALLQNGVVQAEPLISHRLPVERFAEALEIAAYLPERMKVQVVCKEGL